MPNHNVSVDVNKGMAGTAGLACAVGFGYAAFVFGWMQPLLAAFIAFLVGVGAGYMSDKNGMAAIIISVLVFLAAFYH
jgi:hypothetical protein